jgi:hypothetical protein
MQASQLPHEHLRDRYKLASKLKDPVKCAKINDLIKQEEQRDEWKRIKIATRDPWTGATNFTQRKEGDAVVDIIESGAMNEEIQ